MEGIPNNESIDRAQLVEALKTRGFEDPETRAMLNAWTKEQEELVESENTRGAQIKFELNRAKLYFDSGYTDDALDVLRDALYIAEQEGLSDQIIIPESLENKMKELFGE